MKYQQKQQQQTTVKRVIEEGCAVGPPYLNINKFSLAFNSNKLSWIESTTELYCLGAVVNEMPCIKSNDDVHIAFASIHWAREKKN